jgi:exodeoxyribonuclease-5
MRQAEGSGVLDLAIAIRDAQDETARGSNKRMNVRGFASTEVLITQDRRKFEFSYLNRIKFESPDYCRAVAWTNSRVQELNTAARLKLFGAGAQPFYFGESLTLHAPYIVGQDRRVMLPNGYEGGITDIGADSVFVLPGTNSELRVKNLAIDGVWMMVAMDINERVSAFNACAIWAREQKIKTGHSAAWGEFYEAKNAVVDARHCYAVTSHKAQGSTYDTVYVDWANIAKNNSGLERLRSLYVAVTRASNKVFILDSRI